jgi:hypothetical protein
MDEAKHRKWDIVLKVVAAFGFSATFLWGAYTYYVTRDHDFKKEFYYYQTKYYTETSEVASLISLADDLHHPEITKARNRFWQLYLGPMCLVEDDSVEKGMIRFGQLLRKCEIGEIKNIDTLQSYSLSLAHYCRESLGKSWQIDLANLKGKYNK